jgi:hypothetical protein
MCRSAILGQNPKVVEIYYVPHSANARSAASGISPEYRRRANASRRSLRVRFDGNEDSTIARAVSNIDEAILMR